MCWLLLAVYSSYYATVCCCGMTRDTYDDVVVEICVQLKLFFPPTLLWHRLSCDIPHTSHTQTILAYMYIRRSNPQSALKTTDNLFQ